MLEFEATVEQQAIIDAPLTAIAVVACPGSGKTATAVRRVAEVRRRLEIADSRGHVALLSFSNVAVETFRKEYRGLRGRDGDSDRVLIQTVDSFLTSFILRPHGYRVMNCNRTPYLVLGSEPFLSNYRLGDAKNPFGVQDLAFDLEGQKVVVYRTFKGGGSQRLDSSLAVDAKKRVRELGTKGAYTYSSGRIWAWALLSRERKLARALARRFPHIIVDEAQDIGPFEGALLEALQEAGSIISLVGDFNQSIYGFNFARGDYLRNFALRPNVLRLPITQNRRSMSSIVRVANLLAGTECSHSRTATDRISGAYIWRYDLKTLPDFMSSCYSALNAAGYSVSDVAILCRGSSMLGKLSPETGKLGQAAVKHFASAAIEREQARDIATAMEHCAKGVQAIVSGLPDSFASDIRHSRGGPDMRVVRQLLWGLVRSPETGIPAANLPARTSWLPALKANLGSWLTRLEERTALHRHTTWSSRVTAAELPRSGPLLEVDIGQHDWSAFRRGTVHSAKGEGIPAVLYLANKGDVEALVAGTSDEEGRIGFVAVTRSRDLLIVAIPSGTTEETVEMLRACGFEESCPSELGAWSPALPG